MNTPAKFNSLMPLGAPAAEVINNLKNQVSNLNSTVNRAFTQTQNKMNTAMANVGMPSMPSLPGGIPLALGIFVLLIVVFLVVFSMYSQQMKDGYEYLMTTVKQWMGQPTSPLPPMGAEEPGKDVLEKAVPPQAVLPGEKAVTKPLVEKILPNIGSPEVFNVSKNTFTYYDAEPLCRALGAELATYDQVKSAWEKGADWCNYGWVKGQAAVYPTQKETWERIQAGPEEQRRACGDPGLNGGYFDNPELRFGVNCYGSKPNQSQHDEAKMNQGAPLSPGALEVEKKVSKFRSEASSIGIMPFSSNKWSSS
jgi:hypothetical protein